MQNKTFNYNICLLLRNDSSSLANRVIGRFSEYMKIFSVKRTREHFKEVFKHNYYSLALSDLALLDSNVLNFANEFYTQVEKIYWYLMNTEDMPGTVAELTEKKIKILKKCWNNYEQELNACLENLMSDSDKQDESSEPAIQESFSIQEDDDKLEPPDFNFDLDLEGNSN